MVKKMQSGAESAPKAASGPQGSPLASSVKESAQQIWLAGMGAFSKAQAEGGKVFEALVKEGQNLQRKTQGMAEEKLGEVSGRMSSMADTVSARAGQNWDKLESIFETRTAKAMGRLGVPTAKEVQALSERVDALAAAVARLSGAAPAKAARKAAARSPKAAAAEAAAPKAPAKRARKPPAF